GAPGGGGAPGTLGGGEFWAPPPPPFPGVPPVFRVGPPPASGPGPGDFNFFSPPLSKVSFHQSFTPCFIVSFSAYSPLDTPLGETKSDMGLICALAKNSGTRSMSCKMPSNITN